MNKDKSSYLRLGMSRPSRLSTTRPLFSVTLTRRHSAFGLTGFDHIDLNR
jgi:hypothetical protein